jgi:hypothetical protein
MDGTGYRHDDIRDKYKILGRKHQGVALLVNGKTILNVS